MKRLLRIALNLLLALALAAALTSSCEVHAEDGKTETDPPTIVVDKVKPGVVEVTIPAGVDFKVGPGLELWHMAIEKDQTQIYFHTHTMEVYFSIDVNQVEFGQYQVGPGFAMNPKWKVHVRNK